MMFKNEKMMIKDDKSMWGEWLLSFRESHLNSVFLGQGMARVINSLCLMCDSLLVNLVRNELLKFALYL